MFDLWKDDLSPEETDTLVRRAADEIRKRKLEAPAIMLIELHKPLAYVGSQAAIVFAPFIVPFLGFQFVNDYSRLFSRRENVEKLLVELERKDDPTEG